MTTAWRLPDYIDHMQQAAAQAVTLSIATRSHGHAQHTAPLTPPAFA